MFVPRRAPPKGGLAAPAMGLGFVYVPRRAPPKGGLATPAMGLGFMFVPRRAPPKGGLAAHAMGAGNLCRSLAGGGGGDPSDQNIQIGAAHGIGVQQFHRVIGGQDTAATRPQNQASPAPGRSGPVGLTATLGFADLGFGGGIGGRLGNPQRLAQQIQSIARRTRGRADTVGLIRHGCNKAHQ